MYACLYIPSFPAQAVLRLQPAFRRRPVVVLDGEAPRETVLSTNTLARRLGLASGMTRLQSESFPQVLPLRRSLAQENVTKAALFECASRFSPLVEPLQTVFSNEPGQALILDIRGTEGLFGSPEALAVKLRQRIGAYGLVAHVTTSANFHAAACAARGMSGVNSIRAGDEAAALASLPLGVLDLSPEMADTFGLWGIKDCGMLAKLPERDLVARLGFEGQHLRALACGEHPHHFVPIEPDFRSQLIETIELEHPVELLEPLLFLFSRLLDQLLLRVQTRSLAIASIELKLRLDVPAADDAQPCHTRTIRPALPSQDARRLLKLVQLDMETHPPRTAVRAIEMRVEAAKPHMAQHGLFLPQGPEPDSLEVALARLKKLLGEDRVGAAQLLDTQRDDGFVMRSFAPPPQRNGLIPEVIANRPAAFRVCRPPLSIGTTLRGNQPIGISIERESFTVIMRAGPWRRSGEWWSNANWCREEWDVLLSDQVTQKICRIAHDPGSHCWYLVGTYD
jgi:protein ImuB